MAPDNRVVSATIFMSLLPRLPCSILVTLSSTTRTQISFGRVLILQPIPLYLASDCWLERSLSPASPTQIMQAEDLDLQCSVMGTQRCTWSVQLYYNLIDRYAYSNSGTYRAGDNESLNVDHNGQLYLLSSAGYNIRNATNQKELFDTHTYVPHDD